MLTSRAVPVLLCSFLVWSCKEPPPEPATSDANEVVGCEHDGVDVGPSRIPLRELGPLDDVSVAAFDRPASGIAASDSTLPVEAKLLVIAARSTESELAAITSVLQHRGVPFDVLIASNATLTASLLASSPTHGNYQGIVLTTSSLAVDGASQLSPSEWSLLASYEQVFAIRRAVLSATPDPAMGWNGGYTTQSTSTTPLDVTCSTAGRTIFRDVNCDRTQQLAGGNVYLATPGSASLTTLLQDGAGHALAALHTGTDGRESLLLMSRQDPARLHSQEFLHGVLNWVAGGTWLGERRIDMGIQVDDVFLATDMYVGGRYRLDDNDLHELLEWVHWRRTQPSTPDFHMTLAFNGLRATAGDPLTEYARATANEWNWVTHTFDHHHLDAGDYNLAFSELTQNIQLVEQQLPLHFDATSFVSPNISGLVNPEVMQAAADVGITAAVSDTSKPGCDNPSPNMTFYNRLQPTMLLIPRRPSGMPFNVSTPAEWQASYNATGGTATYQAILDDKSDDLLVYMMKGEADPWMFHQANLRTYDGVHSIIGDYIEMAIAKVQQRLNVPIRTPDMGHNRERFANRINYEGAGVRATLYRGRALVIDAGRPVTFPVTGVRSADGEAYGGDVIGMVTVTPGTSTCIPLDDAGLGCSPSPGREGGAGAVTPIPTNFCDGTGTAGLPPENVVVAMPRRSSWRYWDQGDLDPAWRAKTFNDTSWAHGDGPLGYGESYLQTTVSYGPSSSNRHITTYFRTTFDVADTSTVIGMIGKVMYDDGFVAYLNGTEIGRAAMPQGPITATTLSSGHAAENSYTMFNWDAARSLLVAGQNTLAIEVHQQTTTSSDLVFDAEVQLEMGTPPPTTDGIPRQPAIGSAMRP